MNAQKKTLAIVLGGAFAATLVMSPIVNADQNPFAMKTLGNGYQVADAEKMKDGKCGTGKCSASKKKKMMEEKAKEGNCSADKAKEGTCSADKAKEATCSADKAKEGTCHADKK